MMVMEYVEKGDLFKILHEKLPIKSPAPQKKQPPALPPRSKSAVSASSVLDIKPPQDADYAFPMTLNCFSAFQVTFFADGVYGIF